MIGYEQALAVCRTDPEAAAQRLCEWSRELDQLQADFATLKAENVALCRDCQSLRDEVQALKEKSAKDSHNSSQPPSSDGLSQTQAQEPAPAQPAAHRRSARTSGADVAPGGETPDRTVRHPVERCAGCGRSLAQQAPDRVERRQVFDLPEPKLEVTEHQGEVKTCACGCVNRAAFPPEAAAPVQYGLRVQSVAVYLKEYQLLPGERLTEILRDLFGCATFSEGTRANLSAACSRRLAPVDEIIRAQVAAAAVAGFDETDVRLSACGPAQARRRRLAALAAHRLDPLADGPTPTSGAGARPWTPPACCRTSKAVPSTTSGTPT